MVSERKKATKQKNSDLAEYKAKYQVDLMARHAQSNIREMSDRRNWMAKRQEIKEKYA